METHLLRVMSLIGVPLKNRIFLAYLYNCVSCYITAELCFSECYIL